MSDFDSPPVHPSAAKPSAVPVPKVVAATIGAAVATVVVTVIVIITDNPAPPGLEGAIAALVAFVAGYLAPRS